MAVVNKDYRIKHGLVVEGTTATVNGYDVLTKSTEDNNYIIGLIGGSATSAATADTVVLRDGDASFAANVISAQELKFVNGSGTQYLDIYRSGTGTARITAADDLALRATNDIVLYPGNDVSGHVGKAYIHWGDDNMGAYPGREIAVLGNITGQNGLGGLDAVFNTVETTSNGAGQNIKIGDDAWLGDIDSANTVNIMGVENNAEGYVSFGNGSAFVGNDGDQNLVLHSNNNNIILNADNSVYIGSVASNNRVATMSDIAAGAVQSVSGTTNQITATTNNEAVTLSLPSVVHINNSADNYDSIILDSDNQKISLNNANTDSRVLDIQTSNNDAEIRAQYQLNLYSNNSDIAFHPDGKTIANGNLDITNNARVGVDLNIGGWSESNGTILVRDGNNNNKFYVDSSTNGWGVPTVSLQDNTELKFIDNNNEIITGNFRIDPNNYPGRLEINASGELYLTTNGNQGSGNIILNPDSHVEVQGNINVSNRVFAGNGIYVGGSDQGNDGFINIQDYNGNNVIGFNVDGNLDGGTGTAYVKGNVDIYGPGPYGNQVGRINRDTDDNLVINAYQNNLVLKSDNSNSVYIGSVDANNKVVKFSDLAASESGLTWKQAANLLWDDVNAGNTGASGTLIIDGHAALTSANNGYRILIPLGETAGIWDFSDDGTNWTLTRSSDADANDELKGAAIFVMEGDNYGATSWVQSNHYVGSTVPFEGQDWHQFSGQGSYTAGTGLQLIGTEFSVPANTYDSYGAASTAEGSANDYTDTKISSGNANAQPQYKGIKYGLIAEDTANYAYAASDTQVQAFSWDKGYASAKLIIRLRNGIHSQVSEVMLTLDSSDNIHMTEYAIVSTNGSLGDITAEVAGNSVNLLVTPTHNTGTDIITHATLMTWGD